MVCNYCHFLTFPFLFSSFQLSAAPTADKDAIPESPNDLLTSLGHVGEKLFTTTADEFAEYKLDVKREDQEGWEQAHLDQPQAYAYSQVRPLSTA